MRHLLLALVLLMVFSSTGRAQTQTATEGWNLVLTDTLRVYQNLWSWTGYKYKYHDQAGGVGWTGQPVKDIVAGNPAAYEQARKFGHYEVSSWVAAVAAGALIGWGLAEDDDDLVIAGAAGAGVSLVLSLIGQSHLNKAAKIFNAGLRANATTGGLKVDTEFFVSVQTGAQ